MVKNTFLTVTLMTSCGSVGGPISSHQGSLPEVLNVLRRHVTVLSIAHQEALVPVLRLP